MIRPPDLAVLLALWSTDSQKKISKFDATRCHIFRLKCTKLDFAPDSTGGAYSTPQRLYLGGLILKRGEGQEGMGRGEEERERRDK